MSGQEPLPGMQRKAEEPFVALPHRVLDMGLSAGQIALLARINRLAWPSHDHATADVWPSTQAEALGVSANTVRRWLRELDAADLIVAEPPGERQRRPWRVHLTGAGVLGLNDATASPLQRDCNTTASPMLQSDEGVMQSHRAATPLVEPDAGDSEHERVAVLEVEQQQKKEQDQRPKTLGSRDGGAPSLDDAQDLGKDLEAAAAAAPPAASRLAEVVDRLRSSDPGTYKRAEPYARALSSETFEAIATKVMNGRNVVNDAGLFISLLKDAAEVRWEAEREQRRAEYERQAREQAERREETSRLSFPDDWIIKHGAELSEEERDAYLDELDELDRMPACGREAMRGLWHDAVYREEHR